MSETIVVPDNGNNNMNNAWPWLMAGNGGFGGFGGNGFWGAGIGAFLGSALGNFFNGGNGFGGFGGNGGAAAASLGAQATANNNTELLRAAISSNGEQSRQAIQSISTMIGQDFATVSSQFSAINGILNNMAIQNATTPLQIVNAIVSGNKDLAAEFANCCCQNKLLATEMGYQGQLRTVEQTNTLGNIINSNGQRNVDAIADLKTSMISEFCAARERDMQAKIDTQAEIITQLRNAADNANQTNQIAAMIAPLQAKLVAIENRQPNTVSVQYPNLVAMNATPYAGGFYGNGWYGNGWNNGITF